MRKWGLILVCVLAGCTSRDDSGLTTFGTQDTTTTSGAETTSDSGSETTEEGGGTTEESGGSETTSTTGEDPEGPFVLAKDDPAPRGIAVDATHVYWTNQETGIIWRVSNQGGEPEQLAANQDEPYAIAVDQTHAYWTNSGENGSVARADIQNGGFVVLTEDTDGPKGIAIDQTHVFWSDETGVRRMTKDGSSPAIVDTSEGFVGGVALSNTHVYWTDQDGDDGGGNFVPNEDDYLNGRVMRSSKLGSSGSAVVLMQEVPFGIDVDSQSVYWVNGEGDGGGWTQIKRIQKAPLSGGTVDTLAEDLEKPWAILVHDGWVYFSTHTQIHRVPTSGGAPAEVIADMQFLPRYLAVDFNSLYWTNGNGEIMKLILED